MNQCMEKSKSGEICKACGKAHSGAQGRAVGESYNSMKTREATMKSESTSSGTPKRESADKIAGKIKTQSSRASGIRKAELEVGMSYNDLHKAEQDQRRSPEFVKSLAKNARAALANIKSKAGK